MCAFHFPFSSLNSPTNNKQQTTDYKSGIQIYSSHNEKAIFQCNCDSSEDRVKLLKTLEDTINEVGKGEGLMSSPSVGTHTCTCTTYTCTVHVFN